MIRTVIQISVFDAKEEWNNLPIQKRIVFSRFTLLGVNVYELKEFFIKHKTASYENKGKLIEIIMTEKQLIIFCIITKYLQ